MSHYGPPGGGDRYGSDPRDVRGSSRSYDDKSRDGGRGNDSNSRGYEERSSSNRGYDDRGSSSRGYEERDRDGGRGNDASSRGYDGRGGSSRGYESRDDGRSHSRDEYRDRDRDRDRDRPRDNRDYRDESRSYSRDNREADRGYARDRERSRSREKDRGAYSRDSSRDSRDRGSERGPDDRFARPSGRSGGNFGRQDSRGNDGGRFAGRGRGGGRGGMGSSRAATSLLGGQGMTDRDILSVLMPDDITGRHALTFASISTGIPTSLPPVEPWRLSSKVGVTLGESNNVVIRSNHFRVNVLEPSSVPETLYHYHLHVREYDGQGNLREEIIPGPSDDEKDRVKKAKDIETRRNTSLLIALKNKYKDWFFDGNTARIGFTYDGKTSIFTSALIPFTGEFLREDIEVLDEKGDRSERKCQLTITLAETIYSPAPDIVNWHSIDANVLRALDSSLFDFARWQAGIDSPKWVVVGSNAYPTGNPLPLKAGVIALQGYYAALKACRVGLMLVSDLSVTAFLESGPMVNVLAATLGYRNLDDFDRDAKRGLNRTQILTLNDSLKGTKIKCTHLGHWRKMKSVGPPANDKDSAFDCDGAMITVADYFLKQYGKVLKYPHLPTINIGSAKKPVLVPAELVGVPSGQSRAKQDSEMVANLIKYAAVKPDERFKKIVDGPLLSLLRNDDSTKAFGVSKIDSQPMIQQAILLPPAKLQYRDKIVSPELNGSWFSGKFVNPPPGAVNNTYAYGILVVGDRGDWRTPVANLQSGLDREANVSGVGIENTVGRPVQCSSRDEDITSCMRRMREDFAVRMIVVLLCEDVYSFVKLAADRLGIITQCVKLQKISRIPGGYFSNLMLKINVKLGGTNHTLASRLNDQELIKLQGVVQSGDAEAQFQSPPASLSWVFDKACMLVGIDVSHPEPGKQRDHKSIAAVVGSMDGCASQYVAHVKAQEPRLEVVDCLSDSVFKLIRSFRERNNVMPQHIIVYRDGVGESQFMKVLEIELGSIKDAIRAHGFDPEKIRVSYVVCQKGHHTRFAYEDGSSYLNVCPGVCVDATSPSSDITNANYNEFYLVSHTAIQGTAKPAKYTLLYDEIGLKISELELLTYWVTYMYCRCNKSVSIATPCYYAHWASRRARYQLSAGANEAELESLSNLWADSKFSSMYFV